MLSYRQQKIMDCIVQYWRANLVSPSIRELVRACEWSYSTSQMHEEVNTLVKRGYLTKANNRVRAFIPLRDCDGTAITLVMRRADGVEVQLGSQSVTLVACGTCGAAIHSDSPMWDGPNGVEYICRECAKGDDK